jgi:hypothetical protein
MLLLHDDDNHAEYLEEYTTLTQICKSVESGLYDDGLGVEGTAARVLERVTQMIKHTTTLMKFSKTVIGKEAFAKKLIKLKEIQLTLQLKVRKKNMRHQAMSFVINGEAGCGKSFLTKQLITSILKAMGFEDFDDKAIVTLNPNDKYDTNVESNQLAAILNDVGNISEKYAEKAPTEEILRMCDNVAQNAVKADIESKDMIAILYWVVAITSNLSLRKLAASGTNCPASMARRIKYEIFVDLKKKFRGPTGFRMPPDATEQTLPDAWNITISEVMMASRVTNSSEAATQDFVLVERYKGSIFGAIQFMALQGREWKKQQDKLLAKMDKLSKGDFCEHFIPKDSYCPYCEGHAPVPRDACDVIPPEDYRGNMETVESCSVSEYDDQSTLPEGVLMQSVSSSKRARKRRERQLRKENDRGIPTIIEERTTDDDSVSTPLKADLLNEDIPTLDFHWVQAHRRQRDWDNTTIPPLEADDDTEVDSNESTIATESDDPLMDAQATDLVTSPPRRYHISEKDRSLLNRILAKGPYEVIRLSNLVESSRWVMSAYRKRESDEDEREDQLIDVSQFMKTNRDSIQDELDRRAWEKWRQYAFSSDDAKLNHIGLLDGPRESRWRNFMLNIRILLLNLWFFRWLWPQFAREHYYHRLRQTVRDKWDATFTDMQADFWIENLDRQLHTVRWLRICYFLLRVVSFSLSFKFVGKWLKDRADKKAFNDSNEKEEVRCKERIAAVEKEREEILASVNEAQSSMEAVKCARPGTPPVKTKDDEPNTWLRVQRNIPTTSVHACADAKEVSIAIMKCARTIEVSEVKYEPDGLAYYTEPVRSVCFPMKGSLVIVPRHLFHDGKEFYVRMWNGRSNAIGECLEAVIDDKCFTPLGPEGSASDLVLLHHSRLVNVRDLTKFLPYTSDGIQFDSFMASRVCTMDTKTGYRTYHDGWLDSLRECESKATIRGKKFSCKFKGFTYRNKSAEMEIGSCGSAVISMQKDPVLLGFHLAASTKDKTFCAAQIVSQKDFDHAESTLLKCNALAANAGDIQFESHGRTLIIEGQDPHPRHPIMWQQHVYDSIVYGDQIPSCCDLIGVNGERAKTTTSVRESPISSAVALHMELPVLHGAPQVHRQNIYYARNLRDMTTSRNLLRPAIMRRCQDDFMEMILPLLNKDNKKWCVITRPLDRFTVLNGCPGINVMSAVDLNTSMGWPHCKAKKFFIKPVNPESPSHERVLDFTDALFWDEMETLEEALARGYRVYPVFNASLKDEAVKVDKDKMRVFASCPILFTLLVRKYYLPIVRIIQTEWINTECCVGINAAGRDWGKLARYLLAEDIPGFNGYRFVAGDFKAYDKNQSAFVTMSAFQVLIRIAEYCGYPDDALTIMRSLATDVCYPIYNFSGVVIQMLGSNPSGHPLTVIINNIVNSLYMRYAYYTLHEQHREDLDKLPLFHTRVKLACYGDDNIMNVSEEEKFLDHTSIASVLQNLGIVYTMAEKDAESRAFIRFDETSFLKRKFRWENELVDYVAPLDITSISKSLHNHLVKKGSPVSPLEVSVMVLFGACREFFRYGREEFNRRMEQIALVVDECPELPVDMDCFWTYDDLKDEFLGRPGESNVTQVDAEFDCSPGL